LVQSLAQLLPLTSTVALVRPLITGMPVDQPVLHLLVLTAYTVLALWLAIRLLRRRVMA
jgi:lipooligosaccharide transport system permease protein